MKDCKIYFNSLASVITIPWKYVIGSQTPPPELRPDNSKWTGFRELIWHPMLNGKVKSLSGSFS